MYTIFVTFKLFCHLHAKYEYINIFIELRMIFLSATHMWLDWVTSWVTSESHLSHARLACDSNVTHKWFDEVTSWVIGESHLSHMRVACDSNVIHLRLNWVTLIFCFFVLDLLTVLGFKNLPRNHIKKGRPKLNMNLIFVLPSG